MGEDIKPILQEVEPETSVGAQKARKSPNSPTTSPEVLPDTAQRPDRPEATVHDAGASTAVQNGEVERADSSPTKPKRRRRAACFSTKSTVESSASPSPVTSSPNPLPSTSRASSSSARSSRKDAVRTKPPPLLKPLRNVPSKNKETAKASKKPVPSYRRAPKNHLSVPEPPAVFSDASMLSSFDEFFDSDEDDEEDLQFVRNGAASGLKDEHVDDDDGTSRVAGDVAEEEEVAEDRERAIKSSPSSRKSSAVERSVKGGTRWKRGESQVCALLKVLLLKTMSSQ